jgi:Bacterial PH domain
VADRTAEQWIPTHGLRFVVTTAVAASTFLIVAGTALILVGDYSRSPRLPLSDFIPEFSTIVALVAFILTVPILRRPSGVGLATDGVTIRYPGRRIHVAWTDLMRVRFVGHDDVIFRTLSDVTNRYGHAYQITVQQARTILSDPRCPRVPLTEDQRRAIFQD